MLLKEYKSIVKTENGYIIHADAADLMLVFLKEDVIRIRVSFDRTFPEASYALVTTAWEDRRLGRPSGSPVRGRKETDYRAGRSL